MGFTYPCRQQIQRTVLAWCRPGGGLCPPLLSQKASRWSINCCRASPEICPASLPCSAAAVPAPLSSAAGIPAKDNREADPIGGHTEGPDSPQQPPHLPPRPRPGDPGARGRGIWGRGSGGGAPAGRGLGPLGPEQRRVSVKVSAGSLPKERSSLSILIGW